MADKYTLGLDYGTNSVRAILVRVTDGFEAGSAVFGYTQGEEGILLDPRDPNLARQHPMDYLEGAEEATMEAMKIAKAVPGFDPANVIGIGVDTTGSTPLPVDAEGTPLAFQTEFADNLNALAWLWKDHTGTEEAVAITELGLKMRPQYMAKCGNSYSSEWFFSKLWHCAKVDPKVWDAAASWVEIADYIPAVLCDTTHPAKIKRGVCAAGHKAMYNAKWGGLPDAEFLSALSPELGAVRAKLFDVAYTADEAAGTLCPEWAAKLGLPVGIPVAVGAFDAHFGGIGAGIRAGRLVKTLGTSTCDLMVLPNSEQIADIPGLCGIVDGSILPGYWGFEAGQSAVGDIFNWFVNVVQPMGDKGGHAALTAGAGKLKPGESGLLSLDWNNGNRTILGDQRLTGLMVGQTLHSTPAEIYRALIEATAFGALAIINRFEEYGVKINEMVNCGGIAEKNPVVMQIYADIINRTMLVSRSSQTCALGSAIAGAVVAGSKAGGYDNFETAMDAMCGLKEVRYEPIPENAAVYAELYVLYKEMHDAFGTKSWQGNLYAVMKKLIEIRTAARN